MGKINSHMQGSVGPVRVFDASASTGTELSIVLEVPCRYFGVQTVRTSTAATLTVTGHMAASSLSTGGVTLLAFAAAAAGSALTSTESTGPIARLSFALAGASSGAFSAWLCASP